MSNKASDKLSEVMFADDTNLLLSHKSLDILFANMNEELNKIAIWFKANKLSLNVNKTKWSLFHSSSKKRFLPQTLPQLFIDKVVIKRETVTKFLGVFIDENISWKHHIDTVCTKISKILELSIRLKQTIIFFVYSQLIKIW